MKHIWLAYVFFGLVLFACQEPTRISNIEFKIDVVTELPDREVDKSELDFNKQTSIWTFNDSLFSGYGLIYFPEGQLQEKTGFFEGKKQNESIHYFPDGHLRLEANYHKGKLHGAKKFWSIGENHVLVSELNYHLGKAHGVQKKWYPTGELYKILNLNMGKEEGIQQAFRKNGELYANYEARAGRIFGLKKSALCFGLEDENIQYAE